MARQLVDSGVNIQLVSQAGSTPNIVGEALAGAGVAIGGALEEALSKKEGIDKAEASLAETNKKAAEDFGGGAQISESLSSDGVETANKINTTIDENRKKFEEIEKRRSQQPLIGGTSPTQSGGGLASYNKAWETNLEGIRDKYPNKAAYVSDASTKGKETEARRKWAETNLKKGETYNEAVHGAQYKAYVSEKGSPLDRRRMRSGANVFTPSGSASTDALVGSSSVQSNAINAGEQSQFTPGRTYVEKRQKLSAPSWMGIGSAAVEGYNISVEKSNYKKQVQADLQDFYSQEYAGLVADTTGNPTFDNSIRDLMMQEKKGLAAMLNDREAAFARGEGAEWTAKYDEKKRGPQEVLQTVTALRDVREQVLKAEEAGEIDWEAMGDEAKDELMSIVKGGANWGIVPANGGLALAGATRGGMPYVKRVQSFLNEGKGPKYIQKKNAFDYVSSVVDDFRKNQDKYSKTTVDPRTGNKITVPMSFEEIKPYLMRTFDSELTDSNDVRAYASKNNWDGDGMDSDMFDQAVASGIKGKQPKDFVKAKFLESAEQLLQPYLSQYSETGTTVSAIRERERAAVNKESRKQTIKASAEAAKESKYDDLIDTIMTEAQGDFTPDKVVDPKIGSIPELTMKSKKDYPGASIIEGAKGVKTSKYDPSTGLLTITPTSAITVKDGSTTIKTKEPQTIDFTQDPDIVRQSLKNLLEQLKITGDTSSSGGGTQSISITNETAKAKLAEIQNRISGN